MQTQSRMNPQVSVRGTCCGIFAPAAAVLMAMSTRAIWPGRASPFGHFVEQHTVEEANQHLSDMVDPSGRSMWEIYSALGRQHLRAVDPHTVGMWINEFLSAHPLMPFGLSLRTGALPPSADNVPLPFAL